MNLTIKVIAITILIIMLTLAAALLKELYEINKDLPKAEIRFLATHYSKKSQWEKSIEEVEELLRELYMAANPFEADDMVYLSPNTWSEVADVIIMCAQLAMQHGKEAEVRKQIEYKLDRQIKRIEEEKDDEQ